MEEQEAAVGDRRKFNVEEFHNLYSSPNIVRMMKSRNMRWAGHVVSMTEMINTYRILIGKPVGKRPLERLTRIWSIILKWILMKEVGGCGLH
jgi:hypothetical protein